jgi:hypothetical protein
MIKRWLAAVLLFGLVGCALTAPVRADDDLRGKIKHVLLISVDGLHALDVENYVEAHPHSAMAELSKHAVTYSNARTPANSDSFPGLLALITGGSPNSHGLFYDVSYNRSIFDPTNTSCSGEPGNMQVYDETIDKYVGGLSQDIIDPATLPRFIDENHKCSPKFPHNAMRSNTIFEVVRSKGGRTAWADKHPAYDIANGPSGLGVQDLYTPEITNAPGFDNTVSVVCTVRNDQLKVHAILNEIHGFRHDGTGPVGVPAVFGMNFQAVSVGQKLKTDNDASPACAGDAFSGQPGGYLDGAGTPTNVLAYALEETDDALDAMIDALKHAGIYDSTLFIVTAKHGQSPINPLKTNKPGHFADLVAALPGAGSDPAAIAVADANACSTGPCGFVQDDDIALIWLGEDALELDHDLTKKVAAYLNKHANDLFIEEVLSGEELELKFNSPSHDPATPDIIVQPIYGTIYTGSGKNKNEEHGGFSFGDTNVGLIVSNPHIDSRHVKSPVATSQVAASILKALGIDPDELQSVKKEGTKVLPFLFDDDN